MLIFQYDFKIEFYNIKENDVLGRGIPEPRPKIVIKTQNGAPEINLSITNVFSNFKTLLSKQAKLQIYNVPIKFNNVKTGIKINDIVKIYYKKFSYQGDNDYEFIMGGYLGTPMDTDYETGDFSVTYDIYLTNKDSFYNRELENKEFKSKTVENAIREVFKENAILNMNAEDKNKIIEGGFFARTPQEFVEKMLGRYVHKANVDVGLLGADTNANYIFTNFYNEGDKNLGKPYKKLENYALLFIPQQEITTGTAYNYKEVFWNAQTLFTHKIIVGDKVSFVDRYGDTVKGTVTETSATLSNVGDCLLNIKLYDDSNKIPILKRAL